MKQESARSEILARTHGKAAEVQTYFQVYKRWITTLRRGLDAVVEAKKKMNFGKMSGPVGYYTTNSKRFQE